MKTLFLGVGHISRTGKDTVAKFLQKEFVARNLSCGHVSFAAALKAAAYLAYKHYGLMPQDYYDEHPEARYIKLPGINMTPVEIWVEFGMTMRDIYPDTWVDAIVNPDCQWEVCVISDTRFPNEVAKIHEYGGLTIRVDKPGVTPLSRADEALASFTKWDWIIVNDGTLEDLQRMTTAIAESAWKLWQVRSNKNADTSDPKVHKFIQPNPYKGK